MAKYKKHVRLGSRDVALCGSHTSARKLPYEEWMALPGGSRCPMCELASTMRKPGAEAAEAAAS